MSKIKKLWGMFLAASPDMCSGIIIAHLWIQYYITDTLPLWQALAIYMFGVACALLPDVSLMVYSIVLRKELDSHHRDLTHYPLPILTVLGILGFITPWAWFIALGIAAHFIDDTTDPGGIAWIWPITNRKFQVFAKEKSPLTLEQWLNGYFFKATYKSAIVVAMPIMTVIIVLTL